MKNTSATILILSLMVAVTCMGTACAKKNLITDPATTEMNEEKKPKTVMAPDVPKIEENIKITEENRRLEAERALAAKLEKEGRAAEKRVKETALFINEIIYFEFDSSQLSDKGKEQLREKAAWIEANSEPHITIEGHCDRRGTVEYNLALGERRALFVKKYLIDLGVPQNRMTCLSFGEEKPVSMAEDQQSHEKNRRVKFRVQ